jgi:hypothetical protein
MLYVTHISENLNQGFFEYKIQGFLFLIAFLLFKPFAFSQLNYTPKPDTLQNRAILSTELKPFLDSLKKQIINDTAFINRSNLNVRDGRKDYYSKLFIINGASFWQMDDLTPEQIVQFGNVFLDEKKVKQIYIINSVSGYAIFGDKGKNGTILVRLKKKIKLKKLKI